MIGMMDAIIACWEFAVALVFGVFVPLAIFSVLWIKFIKWVTKGGAR